MAPLSQQRLCQHLNDGRRVVQLAWTTDWEDANGVGLLRASCRNATFFRHAFYTVPGADHTTGFCAQGRSGGGAAIAYALPQYKLSDYFDCVVIGAGRGVATGPALNLGPYRQTGGGWAPDGNATRASAKANRCGRTKAPSIATHTEMLSQYVPKHQ